MSVNRRTTRRAAAALAAVVVLLVASLWSAGPASAHAQLVSSDPADGSTLSAAPEHITLRLSESVVASSVKAVLTDGSGKVLQPGAVHVQASTDAAAGLILPAGSKRIPTTIVLDLPTLGPDVYHLAWQTLSADDLHITSGVIVFGVQRDISGATGHVDDPLPSALEVILRWVGLAAAAVAIGGSALTLGGRWIDVPAAVGAARVRSRLLLLVAGGWAITLAAQLLLLLDQAFSNGGSLAAVLTGGYAGRWYAHAGIGLLALVGALAVLRGRIRLDRPWVAPGVALLVVAYAATGSQLGHTGSVGPLELALDAIHVVGAMLWVGAVAAFLVGVVPASPDAELRRRFLRLTGLVAVSSLVAIVATGAALTGRSVASVDALLLSSYGRVLLVKLAAVVAVLYVAFRLRRALATTSRNAVRVAVRLVAMETVALLLVLVGAGALASTRPATGTQWQPRSDVAPLAAGQVEDLVQSITVSPNRPGRNFVTADVYETRRPSPGPVQTVTATLARPGSEPVSLPLQSQGNGRWLAPTDAFASAGGWTIKLTVTRQGLAPAVATYDWVVADPGARLAAPVVSSAPIQPVLDVTAGLVALAGLVLLVVAVRRRTRVPAVVEPLDEPAAEAADPAVDEAVDETVGGAVEDSASLRDAERPAIRS